MEHVDFVVLGGGTAGLSAAAQAAKAGRRVMVVDPHPIGGLCSLRGCKPKKILVRATEVLEETRGAPLYGVHPIGIDLHWSEAIDREHRFTDPVTPTAEKTLAELGVERINGTPRFVARQRIAVHDRTVAFDAVLIAAGSHPRPLAFPGADHTCTSDDILQRREAPREMVVIGTGLVAFELGHLCARLGTRVHLLARSETVLRALDTEVAERLAEYSEAHLDIRLHRRVQVASVEQSTTGLVVNLDNGETLRADCVLNAAGRILSAEAMGLDRAEVGFSERGVEVNEYLRSPQNPAVFAAGDAHGRMHLTPVAGYEARLAATNFLHGDTESTDYAAVPYAVFTLPPAAGVGITETQAREQGLEYDVVRQNMSDWTVFAIHGNDPAHAKVLYERTSGRLLGAFLFGPGADQNINVFAMAMRYGITRERFREMLYVYPSLTSAVSYLT